MYEDACLCFEDGSPIVDSHKESSKNHGRLVTRTVRTSQLLHGYSRFPGLHQVVEVKRTVKPWRNGKAVKRTLETELGITSLSPRQAGAKSLMSLMRRHWHIENKAHYIRDDGWREDRQTWRSGNAYTMSLLLSIALNLLRAPSRHWRSDESIASRAETIDYLLTARPREVICA